MDAVVCTLFPSSCVLCGSHLPQLSSAPICEICWTEFPVPEGPVCARCGDALKEPASFLASGLCRSCRLAPPDFVRATAYGRYQGRMKEAIHALKYDRVHAAARGLGRFLAKAIAQQAAEAPAEMLVIPVPLHRTKHAQRGFNQARSLAREALNALRKTHPAWQLRLASKTLMRLRATESQAGQSPRLRRMNVRGAFMVTDPAAVTMRHVLLVDDILTTGATARAAARALVQAGAASVRVATLARAMRLDSTKDEREQLAASEDAGFKVDANSGNSRKIYAAPSRQEPSF